MTYPLPKQKRQHGNALTERVFYRNGPDYRRGQSVGFREVKRDFGLYSVKVGSWAFEAFVQDAPLTNYFLAKGTKASPEAKDGLYPEGDHRVMINTAFSRYFDLLGRALHSRQDAD